MTARIFRRSPGAHPTTTRILEQLLRAGPAWAVLLGGLLPLAAAATSPIPDLVAVPAAVAPPGEFSAEAVAAARSALQKEIAATRGELAKLPEGTSDDVARSLTEETALLERIDAVHAEQQRTGQHASDLAKEAIEVAERTRNRRPAEATLEPPYGMPLLDQLYDERDNLREEAGRLKLELARAEAHEQEARNTLEEKERTRRAVRQSLALAHGGTKTPGNLRLAELESRLARETVVLRTLAVKTLRLQQSLIEPKQSLLLPRFEWLRTHLNVGAESTAAAAARHAKHAAQLVRDIAAAKKAVESVTGTAIATERRSATEKNAEELESRRADRLTANLSVSVLTARRERLAEVARVAELRRRVLSGSATADELRSMAQENQEAINQLAGERQRQATELAQSRNELQEWQGRFTRAAAADEKPPAWGVERVKRLTAWIELSAAEVADLDRLRTGRNRLREEIGGRVNLFTWSDGPRQAWGRAVAVWNYEMFSVQDKPVRMKTILLVLLLVGLGHRGARWFSQLISRTVLKRLGMNTGRRAAWQALWFYALFVGVLIVAFNLVHLSFTQFSVVSGALAVGIGFGSQNLIGNFISGIILLIERPVNQGDVIEIDGKQVTVEQIGPRSTVVRSIDNTHIIVPNSRLLEQPVTNWTLSDDVVRKRIAVGVAYATPTRKVAELLRGIVAGLKEVRKDPPPVVKFADFGDSSLVFEIYFWVGIAEWVATETELRHRIADVFAAEGVDMAFPQRDVHLDSAGPIQVTMVPGITTRERPAAPRPPGSPATGETQPVRPDL